MSAYGAMSTRHGIVRTFGGMSIFTVGSLAMMLVLWDLSALYVLGLWAILLHLPQNTAPKQ